MSNVLASIPPAHLLLIARGWLFGGTNNNKYVTHVTKILESAAARGDKESDWLLDKLRSKGAIPEFGEEWIAKWRWVSEIMSTENSPWAQYYNGKAQLHLCYTKAGIALLMQSAAAGYAPAMSQLGERLEYDGRGNGRTWIEKAAKLKDPEGLYQLSTLYEKKSFELLCVAAAQGHVYSMHALVAKFSDRFTPAEVAAIAARIVFYSGWNNYLLATTGDAVQRLNEKQADAADVTVLCTTGRMLENYDHLWDADLHPNAALMTCIRYNLTVIHKL
jgi:hypothetical protein